MKDILLIRLAVQYSVIESMVKDEITERFKSIFENDFYVVCFFDENETNKTQFEIIKTKL